MKLGVMVEGQEGLTWQRWRRIMGVTEELGFESLWRSDHLLSLVDGERDSLETWVALTLVAAETTHLRFGPLVSPMTFRHPSLLARMAAALDELSGGRLILGLGAGWNETEHQTYGIPFPSTKERFERLQEGIEVIVRLLGPGPAHYAGRHYQVTGADPRPKPALGRRIPILIGGLGERRVLPLVARYADEWNLTTASLALYRARSERLAEVCRTIGRDPGAIHRSLAVGFIVGGSERELRRRCETMQRLIPSLAGLAPEAVPDAVRSKGWVAGTPDTIIPWLQALAAQGIERVMLQHNDQTDTDALAFIAREIMPSVADA